MATALASVIDQARAAAAAAASIDVLRQERARFTGKKGVLTAALKELGGLDAETRKARGAELHKLKAEVEAIFAAREAELKAAEHAARLAADRIDITLPGRNPTVGALHPLETTARIVISTLAGMGFSLAEGPEIEDDWHNFSALNFPPDHPAKEMQDTFFVAPPFTDAQGRPLLLRTHTSPVQIRAMLAGAPPLKVMAPGKVYRCDADATHSPMFHQIEGFWVDDRVTFRDLKGVLTALIRAVFGESVEVRFRPSFFPFTEPSAEADMRRPGGTWLEVLGCGMIHPNVLMAAGIDPERWQGFAFGLGVERFAMLRYGVPDIRLFYESDLNFLDSLAEAVRP